MPMNDLLFKELLKRGYSLEGKTRVWDIADSKLWYLTPKQAQGFLNLEKASAYANSIIQKEMNLIGTHLREITSMLPARHCNIVDLGCGNGKKAAMFIHDWPSGVRIRYFPIDISSYMIGKAAQTVRRMSVGEVLEFSWNVSDFENLDNVTSLIRDKIYRNHLMLLLGNTLGNFEKYDILNGIKSSMHHKDVLIIGNGIIGAKTKDWTREYRNDHIHRWLVQVPLQLGLRENDLQYDVQFIHSRVEERYILKRDANVKHLGKEIQFQKGDIIVVAISYKYTKKELQGLLKKFFSRVKLVTDAHETYALAICQK